MSNKKCTAAGFEPATSRAGHLYYNHYATNPESRNLRAINYMILCNFVSNRLSNLRKLHQTCSNLISNLMWFDIKSRRKFHRPRQFCVKPRECAPFQTWVETPISDVIAGLKSRCVAKSVCWWRGGVYICSSPIQTDRLVVLIFFMEVLL